MATAPLQGIKVIDMTEVQSGPSCTQMLAWFGAEVIKVERPGKGDATRTELNDKPGIDSLYFLQLNSNKKSVTIDAKTPQGKEVLTKLLKDADIFVENLHPGAIDKLGFSWEEVHKLNPRVIYGTIKGFNLNSPYVDVKSYEPVAQCTGGAASTTGWYSGPYNVPTQSGAALGDSNSGMHLLIGLLAALCQRDKTGEGCYVYQSMQDACLNLCRIKLRDQLILENMGYMSNFPQYPDGKFGDTVPRAGNIEGGGVLGWCYKCKGWETDPNAYVYVILQREEKSFAKACEGLGLTEWVNDPKFNTAEARDKVKPEIYEAIEKYTIQKTKFEVVEELSKYGIPCGPVLSMKEIKEDKSLRDNGSIVEVEQGGERGNYLTVGCPVMFSNYKPDIKRAPDLGQDNEEVLTALGYSSQEIADMQKAGAI